MLHIINQNNKYLKRFPTASLCNASARNYLCLVRLKWWRTYKNPNSPLRERFIQMPCFISVWNVIPLFFRTFKLVIHFGGKYAFIQFHFDANFIPDLFVFFTDTVVWTSNFLLLFIGYSKPCIIMRTRETDTISRMPEHFVYK